MYVMCCHRDTVYHRVKGSGFCLLSPSLTAGDCVSIGWHLVLFTRTV